LCIEEATPNTQRKGAKNRKAREGLTTRYKSTTQYPNTIRRLIAGALDNGLTDVPPN
jgi:hypothetical protein